MFYYSLEGHMPKFSYFEQEKKIKGLKRLVMRSSLQFIQCTQGDSYLLYLIVAFSSVETHIIERNDVGLLTS